MSPNIGGGVRLIKPAKLYMCTQKHYNHNEDGYRRRVYAAMVLYRQTTWRTSLRKLDYNNNEQTWKLSASKVQLAKTGLDPELFSLLFQCLFNFTLFKYYRAGPRTLECGGASGLDPEQSNTGYDVSGVSRKGGEYERGSPPLL